MPKFYSSSAKTKENVHIEYKPRRDEKMDINKKIESAKGIFAKTHEENLRIKPQTRDYLQSDIVSKPTQNVDIEKPRFINKTIDNPDKPKFVEYNKNEDVYYIYSAFPQKYSK